MNYKNIGLILMLLAMIPIIVNLINKNIISAGFGFMGFLCGSLLYYYK